MVAEKYKEVANRELKTAVEQVQCAYNHHEAVVRSFYRQCSKRIMFLTLHSVSFPFSFVIFFRILELFRRQVDVHVIVDVYVAQDTGGDYSKVLQKLLNPDLKIA